MNDRDRRAPVALPGNAPVAQAIGCLFFAQPLGRKVSGDRIDRGFEVQAVVSAAIDAGTRLFIRVPLLPGVGRKGFSCQGDNRLDG